VVSQVVAVDLKQGTFYLKTDLESDDTSVRILDVAHKKRLSGEIEDFVTGNNPTRRRSA
jgi:hypothetical protein